MGIITNAPDIAPKDRIREAILLHKAQEAKYHIDSPAARKDDPRVLALQKDHYQNVLEAYRNRRELTPDERKTRRYLKHEFRKTEARLNPTIRKALIYNPLMNWLINVAIGNRANYKNQDAFFTGFEKNKFQQYNMQNLQERLAEIGFKHDLAEPIIQRLAHGLKSFSFRHNEPGLPNAEYLLHFKKVPGTQAYSFEGYETEPRLARGAFLPNDVSSVRHIQTMAEKVQLSPLETANLVNGRPVMKTVERGTLWFTLNNTQAGGVTPTTFNVSSELTRYPLKELSNDARAEGLVAALHQGQRKEVTLLLPNGKEEKLLIGVSSDLTGLNFHTKEGNFVNIADRTQRNEHLERLLAKGQQLKEDPQIIVERPKTQRISH